MTFVAGPLALMAIAVAAFASAAKHSGDKAHPVSLSPAEIRETLTGKLVSYSPPGLADADVHEEYHRNGLWRGISYGRGPSPFSGRWSVQGNQLCVQADHGVIIRRLEAGKRCRQIWRDKATGRLWMDHLIPRLSSVRPDAAQRLTIRRLPPMNYRTR